MKRSTGKIEKKKREKYRLALVVSRFNSEVTEGLEKGAVSALKECGVEKGCMDVYHVPGAFEIPLVAKKCAKSKKYRGIICLGAVIRGQTPHFDYICESVSCGISRVALETGLPAGFGVVTANTLSQARARSGPNAFNKGREAALAVVEMIDLLKDI